MSSESDPISDVIGDGKRVETLIIAPEESAAPVQSIIEPAEAESAMSLPEAESDSAPVLAPEEEAQSAEAEVSAQTVEVFGGSAESMAAAAELTPAEPVWLWPVSGSVERFHDPNTLKYDVTMRDWRTHEGIDILAPLGSTVCAARGGVVESVINDDLFGTVVTVDHGDGTRAVYANLADMPAVATGSSLQPGYIIGAVGTTAICEIGQETHLHFAVTVNGESVDPLSVLPA